MPKGWGFKSEPVILSGQEIINGHFRRPFTLLEKGVFVQRIWLFALCRSVLCRVLHNTYSNFCLNWTFYRLCYCSVFCPFKTLEKSVRRSFLPEFSRECKSFPNIKEEKSLVLLSKGKFNLWGECLRLNTFFIESSAAVFLCETDNSSGREWKKILLPFGKSDVVTVAGLEKRPDVWGKIKSFSSHYFLPSLNPEVKESFPFLSTTKNEEKCFQNLFYSSFCWNCGSIFLKWIVDSTDYVQSNLTAGDFFTAPSAPKPWDQDSSWCTNTGVGKRNYKKLFYVYTIAFSVNICPAIYL